MAKLMQDLEKRQNQTFDLTKRQTTPLIGDLVNGASSDSGTRVLNCLTGDGTTCVDDTAVRSIPSF